MNTQIEIIGRFSFDVNGLDITYRYKGQQKHVVLPPISLCLLLEETKCIEGFDLDENNEPVILFENDPVKTQYGFDRWNSFYRTFPISYKLAAKLMEWREERREHRRFQAKIVALCPSLEAA